MADFYKDKIHFDLDKIQGTEADKYNALFTYIVNRANFIYQQNKMARIVIENFDNGVENFLLLQICHILSIYNNNCPVYIPKTLKTRRYRKLNRNVVRASKIKMKTVKDMDNTMIFSISTMSMTPDQRDKIDKAYSHITFYMFEGFTRYELVKIAETLFQFDQRKGGRK